MEWVEPQTKQMTAYDSQGIRMCEAARLNPTDQLRVHVATVEAGGVLGTSDEPLAAVPVVVGGGWVASDDGVHHDIAAGQAVVWSPGEIHESGSADGMTVLIIQSSQPLPG